MVNFKKGWNKSAVELAESGMSWRKIANNLGIPKSSCSDFLRSYFKGTKPVDLGDKFVAHRKDEDEDNSRILIISDMHIPFHHPDMLELLKYLKNKYNPTIINNPKEISKIKETWKDLQKKGF